VEQLKLEIACNRPTLSLSYADFSELAINCWIRQTWQFMDAYQIRIEDLSPDFLISRANDQLLIPLFHEQGFRDDQLHRFNLCRLFLQLSRSPISQPAAALRLPKLHGMPTVTRHALPAINSPRGDHLRAIVQVAHTLSQYLDRRLSRIAFLVWSQLLAGPLDTSSSRMKGLRLPQPFEKDDAFL
jgi:hypothetical protein